MIFGIITKFVIITKFTVTNKSHNLLTDTDGENITKFVRLQLLQKSVKIAKVEKTEIITKNSTCNNYISFLIDRDVKLLLNLNICN